MKYCPSCGSEVDASDGYCHECGKELTVRGTEPSETEESGDVSEGETEAEEKGEEVQDKDTEELTDIKAVGETKAEALRDAGYETVDDLREATQEEIAEVENIGKALSARIKSNAERAELEKEDSSGTGVSLKGVFVLIALVVALGILLSALGSNIQTGTNPDSIDTQGSGTTDGPTGGNEETAGTDSSDTETGGSGDTSPSSSSSDGRTDGSGNQDSVLQYGETYFSSTNIEVTVNEPEIIDSYSSGVVDYTPDEGNIFVQIHVTAKNNAEEEHHLPWRPEFNLISGNRQYEPVSYGTSRDEAYSSGSVQPGIVRDGPIVYEVPETTDLSNIQIVLSDEGVPSFEYDTRITWR